MFALLYTSYDVLNVFIHKAFVFDQFIKKHESALLNSPDFKCSLRSSGVTKKFRLAAFI